MSCAKVTFHLKSGRSIIVSGDEGTGEESSKDLAQKFHNNIHLSQLNNIQVENHIILVREIESIEFASNVP